MLPKALAGGGVAYVPQISALSQRRTSELLEPRGLTARVLDFGFLPFSEHFRRNAEHIRRIERLSDAHHLEVCGARMMVGYLLDNSRR